jgi:hypothetical protein
MAKIVFSHARLVEVLKSVFFPITAFELLDSLDKAGYRLLEPHPPPIPPTHRAYVSGRIAEKEDCTIVINSDRKFIGVEGRSPQSVIRIYQDLFSIIEKKFEFSIDEERDYLEFVAEGIVRSRHMPLNKLTEAFKETEVVKKVCKILGEEVGIYTIAFVPRGVLPSSGEWFDIRIEPHITLPSREYDFSVVYRSKVRDKVLKFLNEAESKICSVVGTIDGVIES